MILASMSARARAMVVGSLLLVSACGSSGGAGGGTGGNSAPGSGGATAVGSGGTTVTGSGGTTATGTGGTTVTSSGGTTASGSGGTAPASSGGHTGAGSGGSNGVAGAPGSGGHAGIGSGGQTAGTGGGPGGAAAGGKTGSGGQAGSQTGSGGASAGGAGGALTSACVGKMWPTADPTVAGPFTVAADKNVGPLAGYTPDPIYGDTQQRFNVYRPQNLATSGYCHPILVWANGHGDNPEQNPPLCVVNSSTNQWCGTYPVIINQLASHGFVVVASLSTTTSRGDPLPTITGLNWLLAQAEDPTSPYYHRLDTSRIGALGHSEGGLSTCKAAADPRISVVGTISGTSTLTALHGPALFICGGKDTVVSCDSVMATYNSVTDQPAMFMDNLSADHGGWEYQNGAKGPDIFAMTAWFRVHLMNDTANRKYFYGNACTLCTDNRVTVQRNSLLTQ